jgi:hypothetical protein
MRRPGADSSVVAVTWGNAHRAKGGGHPRRNQRANGRPEEPIGFDGRRQPSVGGTSRMNREVHVRLCVQQRLACSAGVKPAGVKVRAP